MTSDNEDETRPAYNVYTNEDRKAFAVLYNVVGNVKEIARLTGWSDKTMYGWLKSDWFPRFYDEAKREHAELIEARLSSIVEKATNELLDKIEHGNVVVVQNKVKKGKELHIVHETIRVPLEAKTLNQIIVDSIAKLRLLQNKPSRVTAEVKFDADKIAREFADIAARNRTRVVSEQ
jgi:hypothetical protein